VSNLLMILIKKVEKNSKIGWHLSKLWTNIKWHVFMAHGVQLEISSALQSWKLQLVPQRNMQPCRWNLPCIYKKNDAASCNSPPHLTYCFKGYLTWLDLTWLEALPPQFTLGTPVLLSLPAGGRRLIWLERTIV